MLYHYELKSKNDRFALYNIRRTSFILNKVIQYLNIHVLYPDGFIFYNKSLTFIGMLLCPLLTNTGNDTFCYDILSRDQFVCSSTCVQFK